MYTWDDCRDDRKRFDHHDRRRKKKRKVVKKVVLVHCFDDNCFEAQMPHFRDKFPKKFDCECRCKVRKDHRYSTDDWW